MKHLLLTTIAAVVLVGCGESIIHDAAAAGDLAAIQAELDKGVDVNIRDPYGKTPLHVVKTKEIAELLIAKGADVNAKTYIDFPSAAWMDRKTGTSARAVFEYLDQISFHYGRV